MPHEPHLSSTMPMQFYKGTRASPRILKKNYGWKEKIDINISLKCRQIQGNPTRRTPYYNRILIILKSLNKYPTNSVKFLKNCLNATILNGVFHEKSLEKVFQLRGIHPPPQILSSPSIIILISPHIAPQNENFQRTTCIYSVIFSIIFKFLIILMQICGK